jgi:2-oxoglutarate dehydrogenase E1 component
MDKYSFLNAVHPAYIAELYDKYLQFPDSIEPSWRAFFQGFDFGIESGSLEALGIEKESETTPQLGQKEFQVIKLIDGSYTGTFVYKN